MRPPGGVPSGSLLKQSDGDGDAIGLLVATALPARDHAVTVRQRCPIASQEREQVRRYLHTSAVTEAILRDRIGAHTYIRRVTAADNCSPRTSDTKGRPP